MDFLDDLLGYKYVEKGSFVLPQRDTLCFTGPGVVATDDPNARQTLVLVNAYASAVSVFTPETLTANVVTLEFGEWGFVDLLRLSAEYGEGADIVISGFGAFEVSHQLRKTLVNVGSRPIVIEHDADGAPEGTHVMCPHQISLSLEAGDAVDILYDFVGKRWYLIP